MMGELIFRNLLHRPARTFIGILAISVEVALVVLIVGLTSGLLTETAKRIEGVGADIMLQPPAASIFLGFSGSPMPIKIQDKLRQLKYVQAVAPVLLQFNSTGGVEVVYGIDPESFREVTGGFVFLSGHDMQAPDDVLVDDWAARAKHLKAGDTYNLFNNDWHVAGIVEHGKGSRVFCPHHHAARPYWRARQSLHLLYQMHAPRARRRRNGRYAQAGKFPRLHGPPTEGSAFPDDFDKYSRAAGVH